MSERYKSTFRGYLIDHHSPDPPVVTLEHLDAEEWERFFLEAHIDHLMLYCKDHWGSSYYDTKIGRKHPGLMEKDWVAQIVPILHKHQIEFTAYYCFEYDSYAPTAHPEWSVYTKDGVMLKCGMPTNSSNAKWGIPCMETGYREYALGQLREIVEQYHPDSLFLDIFGKTLCYCPICKERYRKRFGYEMPETDEEMMEKNSDLVAFLDDDAERLLDDVRAVVKAIDPTLAVTINFASHYPKKIRDKLDYMYTEPWAGNWLSGAYARDTSNGKHPQLGPGDVSQVFNYQKDSIYELATAEIAAQGCHVFLYSESMREDGSLEFEEAKRIGAAFQKVEQFEEYLKDRTLQADIAIVQSDLADALRVDQPIQIRCVSRAKVCGLHREALLGAMKLCDYSKRTWCVVPEEELDLARMKQYKILVLPNLFYLRDQLKEDLRRYVEEGGCLLLSGESGLYDAKGEPLKDFDLADLMGCHYISKDETYRKNNWSAYIRQTEDVIWEHSAKTTPPVGGYVLKTASDGAKALGTLIEPAVLLTDTTWVNWGNPLPGKDTGFAALYENQVGEGKVLTACFDLFTMANNGFEWIQTFFADAMGKLFKANICLDTELKHLLEYTCYERENSHELILHELSAMARLTGGDTAMVPGGSLQIQGSFRQIQAAEQVFPVHREIPVQQQTDGSYLLELPPLDMHAIYRILYSDSI